MDTNANPRAVMGGNRPLEDILSENNAQLPELLRADTEALKQRVDELIANALTVPAEISNDEQEKNVSDIGSQISKEKKNVDARFEALKAGPLQAGRMVDSFFKEQFRTPIDHALAHLRTPLDKYKLVKVERARQKREEEARIAREKAEEEARIAAEAEAKRRAAEEAQRKAEAEAKAAEQRRLQAIKDAEEAERKRVQAIKDAEEAEARQKAAEAAAAEAATRREKERLEREAREAADAKAQAEKAAQAEADAKERAKSEAAAARRQGAEARVVAQVAKSETSAAKREERAAQAEARGAEKLADKTERAVEVKAAVLSQSRGDYGGQSALATNWVGRLVDRAKLLKDIDALYEFISDDDLQKAVNAFVRVHKGTRKLRGVDIYEDNSTRFR